MITNYSTEEIHAMAQGVRDEIEIGDPMTDLEVLASYIKDELECRRADGEDISEDDILVELHEKYFS